MWEQSGAAMVTPSVFQEAPMDIASEGLCRHAGLGGDALDMGGLTS